MRVTSAGLKAAMSATPHTLGWLGLFVFADGTAVRVSASGKDQTFDSQTWTADKSFKGSTLKFIGDGTVPDGEVTAPAAISDAYDDEDVYAGTFEGMQITLFMFSHADPSVGGMQLGPQLLLGDAAADVDRAEQLGRASCRERVYHPV